MKTIRTAYARNTAILALTMTVAAVGADHTLNWSTIDGGGGFSASGSVVLAGTLSQADAGAPMTGGGLTLAGGFWAGIAAPGPAVPGDCDADGDVDFDDFAGFVACFNGPGGGRDAGCGCFDLDQDQAVTLADFAVLHASFTGP